jgi:hypothetical protein
MVMSSDETPREEPKFEAAAPSIIPAAGDAKGDVRAAAEPATAGAATSESSEKLPEAPRLSAERDSSPEPKPESIAGRKGEATVTRLPALRTASEDKKAGPELAKPRGSSRFALLAACVAIAASFGAVAGSLGVARLGPMFAAAPPPAPVTKDNVAEEVKALKDTVAQLRGTTKALSDNLAALKTSVGSSNAAQNTQIGRIAETLDRVEKAQTEQRKMASAETTGSIAQKQAVPMVLGDPPTTLKPPVVQGWVLRRVYDGAALIEGRDGIVEVEPGVIAPGIGRIESIKRQDGRWVVVTSRGLIVGR